MLRFLRGPPAPLKLHDAQSKIAPGSWVSDDDDDRDNHRRSGQTTR